MKLFPYVVFMVAIAIAVVAAWFSIAGLMAIFAASAIPVAIMAASLEIGKLVTASWVYRNWDIAPTLLKSYLTIATVVLMFITSMGIFGYLSRAHIEHVAQAGQGSAQVERLANDITKGEADLVKLSERIAQLETQGDNATANVQSQIDLEQARMDQAAQRIQPAIDEQNKIIASEEARLGAAASPYESQIIQIDTDLAKIDEYIAKGENKKLQALIGIEPDGFLGPKTTLAIEAWRAKQLAEKQRLAQLVATEKLNIKSEKIDAAQAEIKRLRSLVEAEVAESQKTIAKLREQLGSATPIDNAGEISQLEIKEAELEKSISSMEDQKFDLETELRKMEAEVGPIKYIAELVYGTTDSSTIDKAVRWLIITFIFVFDPLAVLLLIAANFSFLQNQRGTHHEEESIEAAVFGSFIKKSIPDTEPVDKQDEVSDTDTTIEVLETEIPDPIPEPEIVEDNLSTEEMPAKKLNTKRKPIGWLDRPKK